MSRQKVQDNYQTNESNNSRKRLSSVSRIFLKNLLGAKHLKLSKYNSLKLFKKTYFESQQCNKNSGYFYYSSRIIVIKIFNCQN